MRVRVALALAALLALPAAAQHAHHGGDLEAVPASVHVDVADPEVVASHPVAFTVVLLDAAGAPRPHQDMRIRATFAGTVLFEVPAATGHDYDGLNEVTLTFPSPGPFAVELLDAAGKTLAKTEGWAVERQQRQAVAHLVGPSEATVGEAAEYRMWPAAPDGSFVKHFYTLLEAWDEDGLALQAKLHGHRDEQVNESVVQLGFPHPGRWLLRAHLFQAATYGPQAFSFAPLVAELAVDVTGEALPPSPGSASLAWSLSNGTETPLAATVDPQPELGLSTPARITTRARTGDGQMRTHVDFNGTLRDGAGRVLFDTDRLHESDGLLQVLVRPGVPGDYLWSTVADVNGTRVDVPFRVLAGEERPAQVEATLPAFTVGQPAEASFTLRDAGGQGLPHSEVELEVLDGAGRLRLAAKLHTHDGSFPFTLTMLDAGPHTLRVQPHGLGQENLAAAAREFAVEAAPGAPWPVEHRPEPEPAAAAEEGGAADVLPPLAWRAAAAVLLVGLAATGSVVAWRRTR